MDSGDAISVQILGDLKNIDRVAWDTLANPAGAPFDPFLSWDFLQALEESGCAAPAPWRPSTFLSRPTGTLPTVR